MGARIAPREKLMPFYEYECPHCGELDADIRCVSQRDDGPWCHECDLQMKRIPSAPQPPKIKGEA
jgi:putative FmdB family regulatory protein